jgi:hypothetical protein
LKAHGTWHMAHGARRQIQAVILIHNKPIVKVAVITFRFRIITYKYVTKKQSFADMNRL